MTAPRRKLPAAGALLLALLLPSCGSELEPTGAITLTLAKAAGWPDTLAVAEIASATVAVTGPGQRVVTGVTLVWGSSDSSVATVARATAAPGATPAEELAASLRGIVTSRRTGTATIVVRVAQAGFEPVELSTQVVVRTRGADSLLSVGDIDTIGLSLQRADPAILAGATVTWSSSDPSVLGVAALGSDPTRAAITARISGSAEVSAIVQGPAGRATFQLPVAVLPLQIVELPAWGRTINLNNSATYAVQVRDGLGQVRTGLKVQWRSTNEAAFSVDSLGVVRGKSKGGGELVASVGAPPFQVAEHRAIVQVMEKWRAVSSGGAHTCAIAALDGTGYCWGSNTEGQLGSGFDATALFTSPLPRRVATAHKFTELLAGGLHSCGREGAQTLLCWGSRQRGQVGDGPCVLGGMGTTCFGSAESPVTIVNGGRLGTALVHLDQIVVGGTFSCLVDLGAGTGSFASRDLRCWGIADDLGRGIYFADSATTAPLLDPGLTGNGNVTLVTAGDAHLCAMTDEIWWVRCMGVNDRGQLGDGTIGNPPNATWSPKPFSTVGGDPSSPGGDGYPTSNLAAGGNHTCGLDAIGVLCWGDDAVYPTRVNLGATAVALSSGESHTCALVTGGAVWCWGSNTNGQLGRGTVGGTGLAPGPVSGGLTFTSISAGGLHTCGVTTDGSLYCWGDNLFGQVGDGSTTDRGAPVRVGEAP